MTLEVAADQVLYEGGRGGRTLLHVLYGPEVAEEWGKGVALQRTAEALEWMEDIFGPYRYPYLTKPTCTGWRAAVPSSPC